MDLSEISLFEDMIHLLGNQDTTLVYKGYETFCKESSTHHINWLLP